MYTGHRPAGGDLIALGSKSGAPKLALRHEQLEEGKKPGGSSAPGGPPVKKLKTTPSTGESSGGLFSNPIIVSQVSSSTPSSMSKPSGGVGSKALSQQTTSSGPPGALMIEGELVMVVSPIYKFRLSSHSFSLPLQFVRVSFFLQ